MRTNRYHSDVEYVQYMEAYDEFYLKKLMIFGKGCPRLDSQFSESIAADYFDFDLNHANGYDGYKNITESCEVKGTGYTNSKVRFSLTTKQADHILWVKSDHKSKTVKILEIKVDYTGLDKNGFIDLTNNMYVSIINEIGSLNYQCISK